MHAIYQTHARPLFGYLLRLTGGDEPAAEDLVQDTLLQAWRNIRQLPADVTGLRLWLYRAAAEQARQVRRPSTYTNGVPARGDGIERVITAADIRRGLRTLSPGHRRVLVELYYRGGSTTETAARMGIPVGTVKSRAHYGLHALRSAIGEIDG
jgi:RNA polymerase sigma-70 factor (ECF subfamily)